jgi:hypothetical protein
MAQSKGAYGMNTVFRRQIMVATVAGLAVVADACPALAAGDRLAPSKGAIPSQQPTRPWPLAVRGVACEAIGSWTDDYGSGPGVFKRRAAPGCRAHGDWRDAFGYTWRLKTSGEGQLTGRVNYHGLPSCQDQVWPVTGAFSGSTFTVTATNPVKGDGCASVFSYSLTVTSPP